MGEHFGTFPFGRPNTERDPRMPDGRSAALVVGVYPSAFHVAWSPPGHAGRRALISSLAVDVEPTVFWDGKSPSPVELLNDWKMAVGFDADRHGTVRPGHNGPSGVGLEERILAPLGLTPSNVAFTDAVPWFFVKHGAGSQGAAIAERFAPWAERNRIDPGSLPKRPSIRDLPKLAGAEPRRTTLRHEIVSIGAPLVITLGQEALDAIRLIADDVAGAQPTLAPDGYGRIGALEIDGQRFDLLPVAHPGFLRQTKRPDWLAAFESWEAAAPRLR
ncbi:MAG: hypothetical protein R2697_09755 [Ilumatobacteraceae bacterium]